jgi:RNA recognition motif-containing protein
MNRRTLYVGGLSPSTKLESLRAMLSQFGAIEDARLIPRSSTRGEHAIAYVTFVTGKAAMHATRVLDGADFEGARIRVDYAR